MTPPPGRSSHWLRDLATLGLLTLAATALVAGYTVYRITEAGRVDERHPAGAIVVLGAAQYDGRPSPVFRARLDHAVALYREGLAPLLVTTGGKRPGDRVTEAETARAYAIEQGVPASAILMEDQGRTTLESLTGAAAILRAHGVREAIFVSDPTHMLRVRRIADDRGIRAWSSPTRTSPVEHDPTARIDATLHEVGALALYFLSGGSADTDAATGRAAGTVTTGATITSATRWGGS